MDLPSEPALRWILTQCAHLRAAHAPAFADGALIEPTAAFFPDDFRGDAASVDRLARRMISYAPISEEVPIQIVFGAADDDGAGDCGGNGCGVDACGGSAQAGRAADSIEPAGDGYRWRLEVAHLGHPHLLTAALARGVGQLVRLEGEQGGAAPEAELTGVMCGFGVLLLNGAEVWGKSCGGLRRTQVTSLRASELAIALALFLAVHGHPASACRSHLETAQREALGGAIDWAASNEHLVGMLRDQPALLETGLFELEPVRGPLARWLHRREAGRVAAQAPVPSSATRPARSEDQRRRFEEARSLVDEVLGPK
ncbi:MAG: hypothetical protein JOZ69_23985 [Myxococcales bacterium]|nr:hypothetical protein [Myxococcales bacterium]